MSSSTPPFTGLPWPTVETRLSTLVRNAEATLIEITHPEAVVPVIVPDLKPQLDPRERAWVTCMESGLIGYVIDELTSRQRPTRLQALALNAYRALGACGPWRRAVQVGNLPFSTTLRSEAGNRVIWEILPALREAMPDRPFAVRNVYPARQDLAMPDDAFLLPGRPTYRFDYADGNLPGPSNFKRDLKLLNNSGLTEVGDDKFDEELISQGLGLFDQLYRQKHSLRNPDYTEEMIAMGRQRGWLTLRGLLDPKTERLVAFAGVHEVERAISAPLIGYDRSIAQKVGLYRQLLALLAKEAIRRGMIDDSSSGAGEFKRNRGLLPELEYFAILPPLTGVRRPLDRVLIRLRQALMRDVTLEQMLANGG